MENTGTTTKYIKQRAVVNKPRVKIKIELKYSINSKKIKRQ